MNHCPIRHRLGEWCRISVMCRNGTFVPSSPDAAPQLSIYVAGGTEVVSDQKMVPFVFPTVTGMFYLDVFLSSAFTAGAFYFAHIGYAVSSVAGGEVQPFEVTAGGNANGSNQAVFYYPRPDSDWIVCFRDGVATYEYRQNPRVQT